MRHRIPSNNPSSSQTTLRLVMARMQRLQTMQSLAELRRKPLICLRHVEEQRVSATGGAIEQIQKRCAGGLLLVRDVRVPGHRVGVLFEEFQSVGVVGRAVDEMDLGIALGGAGCWVDVVSAEVTAEFESLVDGKVGEVLVSEGCSNPSQRRTSS
jgi:hypothetical protein